MRLKLFFAGVVLVSAVVVLMAACGNSGNTNDQADGSGEDASTDATVSNQDGQSSNDGGSPKDGAGSDGSATDGGSEGGVVCNGGGVLDPTFGDGGIVWLEYPGAQATSVLVQPDGKIVVAGSDTSGGEANFVVVRLMPDGSLDGTFGSGGLVEIRVGDTTNQFTALALQTDGKIVAAGVTRFAGHESDFAVLRYLEQGSLDPTFGDAGVALTDFGGGDQAASIVILPDSRIVVGGQTIANGVGSTGNYAIARYNSDGTLDTTFGAGGKLTLDVHGTGDFGGIVAPLLGAKMLVAGASAETSSNASLTDISAVRTNSDGTLDTSFVDAGKWLSAFGDPGSQAVFAATVDTSARVLLACEIGAATNAGDFAILRLGGSGLDPTFGDGGLVTVDFAGRSDQVATVLSQGDGKLVAVGTSGVGAQSDTYGVALARLLPNGTLDPTFGLAGTSLTLPPTDSQLGANGAALSGCQVIAVGTWFYDLSASGQNAIGIARYRL